MSTELIWLIIETYRDNHCTSNNDADSQCFWNSYTVIFSTIWKLQLLIITHNIIPVLANTVPLLCGQGADIRLRQSRVWCYRFGDDIDR